MKKNRKIDSKEVDSVIKESFKLGREYAECLKHVKAEDYLSKSVLVSNEGWRELYINSLASYEKTLIFLAVAILGFAAMAFLLSIAWIALQLVVWEIVAVLFIYISTHKKRERKANKLLTAEEKLAETDK